MLSSVLVKEKGVHMGIGMACVREAKRYPVDKAYAKSHFLQFPMGQNSGQSLFPDSDLLDLGRAMATWSRKSARV